MIFFTIGGDVFAMSHDNPLNMYGATYESVADSLEKHHNTSPNCAIISLHSSLYLDYFATLIKENLARCLSNTCTMIYVGFTVF